MIELYFKATKGIGTLKVSGVDVVIETIVYAIRRNDQSKLAGDTCLIALTAIRMEW
ncbi:hypothetical protein [Psychrobacillus sp. L4]|uniref:hypothetical protein n=1 Tax=Psychrobacillus sp. L4 TaxID=3236892 RepID=UPI0036F21D35